MFEFLAKLLGLGGTSQQQAQPASPAMNVGLGALATPGTQPTQHTGTPVPKMGQPYADIPMQLGTVDKPFSRQAPPNIPSKLNAQVPGNLYPSYSVYGPTSQPNGQWLENDNAPQGQPPQRSYLPTQQLPDQPFNPTQFTNHPGIAQPQYRQPQPPSYPVSRA